MAALGPGEFVDTVRARITARCMFFPAMVGTRAGGRQRHLPPTGQRFRGYFGAGRGERASPYSRGHLPTP